MYLYIYTYILWCTFTPKSHHCVPAEDAHLNSTYDSRSNQTPLGTLPKRPYAPEELRREEDHRVDTGGHLEEGHGHSQDQLWPVLSAENGNPGTATALLCLKYRTSHVEATGWFQKVSIQQPGIHDVNVKPCDNSQ